MMSPYDRNYVSKITFRDSSVTGSLYSLTALHMCGTIYTIKYIFHFNSVIIYIAQSLLECARRAIQVLLQRPQLRLFLSQPWWLLDPMFKLQHKVEVEIKMKAVKVKVVIKTEVVVEVDVRQHKIR